MGANAVTTVPVYVAGEVLTAADLNITNSGIPVFATSVERDAAFGGTGEKVLAEGQYAYLESTKQTLVYDGSNWVTVGVSPGLVLIKTETIGTTVASVTVTGAFSATYDNYKIVVSGGAGSVSIENLLMTLGATATGYYWARTGASFAGVGSTGAATNTTSWRAGGSATDALSMSLELFNPFLADQTLFASTNMYMSTTGTVFTAQGFLNNTTSYTAFTLTVESGTMTGGTIRVYGYANS